MNLNIPIFNGFLYSAEAKEAAYRSRADAERAGLPTSVRRGCKRTPPTKGLESLRNCSTKRIRVCSWHKRAID